MQTMIHPFTHNMCEVRHLVAGDQLEAGDVYRSATIKERDSESGQWWYAGEVLEGSTIGTECNVSFVRLLPIV